MSENPQEQPTHETSNQANAASKVSGALRPLAKEIIKGGLMTYAALCDSLSGVGKQFNELVDEAKAELAPKEPPSNNNSADDSPP